MKTKWYAVRKRYRPKGVIEMNREELAPHIEELKKVLKDNATEEQIAKELDTYINKYRQDIEVAKRGIIRKLGNESTGFITGENVVKKIADLNGNEANVDVVAKVLFSNKKTINGKNGPKDIISALIGDETGTVSFTDWSCKVELEVGKTYTFKNCYAKLWGENIQLNLGTKGTVETSDAQLEVKKKEFTPPPAVSKKIEDIDGTERNVDVTAKVVFSEVKEVPAKDGGTRKINSGILGDETGTISFTLWNGEPVLEKGEVYDFKNCYAKLWNDKVQLNIGTNGSVQKSNAVIETVSNRQKVTEPTEMKIGDITKNSANVTITGQILSVESRNAETKNGPKTVHSGVIADDTGRIQFSAWNDFGFEEGKSYRISNAYVRTWKDIPQINLGDNTQVSASDFVLDETTVGQGTEKTIGDIAKNGGAMDVIIRGIIVDVRPGSGIIERCPECKRTMVAGKCMTHGEQEPIMDLRMRIVVDDGTGSIAATINRDSTEKFTGVDFDAAFNLFKARGNDFVVKELSDKLYMKHLKIRGNAMSDQYGLKINAKEITQDDIDVKKTAKELLDKIQEVLS